MSGSFGKVNAGARPGRGRTRSTSNLTTNAPLTEKDSEVSFEEDEEVMVMDSTLTKRPAPRDNEIPSTSKNLRSSNIVEPNRTLQSGRYIDPKPHFNFKKDILKKEPLSSEGQVSSHSFDFKRDILGKTAPIIKQQKDEGKHVLLNTLSQPGKMFKNWITVRVVLRQLTENRLLLHVMDESGTMAVVFWKDLALQFKHLEFNSCYRMSGLDIKSVDPKFTPGLAKAVNLVGNIETKVEILSDPGGIPELTFQFESLVTLSDKSPGDKIDFIGIVVNNERLIASNGKTYRKLDLYDDTETQIELKVWEPQALDCFDENYKVIAVKGAVVKKPFDQFPTCWTDKCTIIWKTLELQEAAETWDWFKKYMVANKGTKWWRENINE